MGVDEARISPNFENSKFFENLEAFEVLSIDLMSDTDWRKPIVEYLGNSTGAINRKIKYMALNYVIMGNNLFKKNPFVLLS